MRELMSSFLRYGLAGIACGRMLRSDIRTRTSVSPSSVLSNYRLMALRRSLRPFLKAVHPDLLHQAPAAIKRVNEQSLQQVNTIVDTLEHLGGARKTEEGRASRRTLEQVYHLQFYVSSATQGSCKLKSFTTSLVFPFTAMARFQRAAPFAAQDGQHQPRPVPPEVAVQLRKLFEGARLEVPEELSAGLARKGGVGGGRRRPLPTTQEQYERLLMDGMEMAGDRIRVPGGFRPITEEDKPQLMVSRFVRSGHVLVHGLSIPQQILALRHLELLLLREFENAWLALPGVMASLIIVIDAEQKGIQWEVKEGKNLITMAPMTDRRLQDVLKEIGRRAEIANRDEFLSEDTGLV